jgi:hypothetical protein
VEVGCGGLFVDFKSRSLTFLDMERRNTDDSVVVAFRAPRALADAAEAAAAREGLTRSAVARRALLNDLRARAASGEGIAS